MMKLVNPQWEHQIDFSDGKSTVLILENPEVLRNYVVTLSNQISGEEGPFVLSEEDSILKIPDHVQLVLSPLEVGFSDKKISSRLQLLLKSFIVSADHYQQTQELLSRIDSYAENLSADFPYNIKHDEPDPLSLLKFIGFEVQTEYENEIEKIMEYINILHDICQVDCFVFVGMFNYFSIETMNTFISEALSNKHNLLFIEHHDQEIPISTRKIVVDIDSCEIF